MRSGRKKENPGKSSFEPRDGFLERDNLGVADGIRDLVLLVPAAGIGSRLFEGHEHVPKAFLPVRGCPLILWTLEALATCPGISRILVAVPRGWKKRLQEEISKSWWAFQGNPPDISVYQGGRTRADTVCRLFSKAFPRNDDFGGGFKECETLTGIHDGVRPLVSHDLIQSVAEAARRKGGAVPLLECEDTIKTRGENGFVGETLDRNLLGRVQTPQIFQTSLIRKVLNDASFGEYVNKEKSRSSGVDEALLFQEAGYPVAWVRGEPENIKLTWSSQIPLIEALVQTSLCNRLVLLPPEMPNVKSKGETFRVGVGFDAHRFVSGRPLFLGGVLVEHDMGLEAHSDGDVVVHALADAILGGAALGDIGLYFPPGRPETRDLPGVDLLKSTLAITAAKGWSVCSVDLVIITQEPAISPYRDRIRKSLAECLEIPVKKVSVKATSTEGIGFAGCGEGMAAQAVVVMECCNRR